MFVEIIDNNIDDSIEHEYIKKCGGWAATYEQ